MSQKDVHDEFAISYAEEILHFLAGLVYNACFGCKNGVDRNSNTQQHDICTLLRRKHIKVFTDTAVLMVGSVMVQKKVVVHLKSRNVVFNKNWIYEDRWLLIATNR